MRRLLVFTAACAGSAPRPPPAPPPPPPRVLAILDAAPDAPEVATAPRPPRAGDACRAEAGAGASACGDAGACLAEWTGGYCAARCDADRACAGSDTACVPTPRLGDVCARACASDADCRGSDGYTCDATWHACLLPNTAAIVPRSCPANDAVERSGSAGPRSAAEGQRGVSIDNSFGSASDLAMPRAPALAVIGGEVATVGGAGSDEPAAAGALAAWVIADVERRTLAVGAARGVRGVEGDDCATDASCPERPRLAAAPHAVYLAYSGDAIGTRVRAAAAAGDAFGPAVTALAGARGDIAASTDGRVHVVAMRGGTGGAYGAAQHAIEYTVSKDGARTFARPALVSARDELIPAYFASPVLAVDDRRNFLYVAYVRGATDGVWDVVIAASKDKGVTWTRSALGDGCSLHAVPSLAVDPTTGTLHVLYLDARAGGGRVVHAACAPGGARCSERGALPAPPFAAFDTGRLDARWVGDQTALVVDDKHRTLTAAWAQPITTADGHVVARAFRATAKL